MHRDRRNFPDLECYDLGVGNLKPLNKRAYVRLNEDTRAEIDKRLPPEMALQDYLGDIVDIYLDLTDPVGGSIDKIQKLERDVKLLREENLALRRAGSSSAKEGKLDVHYISIHDILQTDLPVVQKLVALGVPIEIEDPDEILVNLVSAPTTNPKRKVL